MKTFLKSRAVILAATGIISVFVIWQLAVTLFQIPSYILPSLGSILSTIMAQRSELGQAGLATFTEALLGFALGSLAGLFLAIVMTMMPKLKKPLLPLVTALNSVPVVAYAPLILLWFGVGAESKIIMVALAVGFTIFIHALTGLGRVDHRIIDLMRSFGSSPIAVLWRIRLPAALPLIIAGMRLSTVRSIIVAIVTEMLGAYQGLGWTIYQSALQINFVQVWAAIFVASAGSLIFFGLVNVIEKRYVFWK